MPLAILRICRLSATLPPCPSAYRQTVGLSGNFALLLPCLLFFSLPLSAQLAPSEPAPSGVAEKGTVNVLGKEFADLPILWRDEPYVPVGEWLKGLGLSWTVQGKALVLQLPQSGTEQMSVVWTAETVTLSVRDLSVKVAPLLQADGRWWLPLVSLARLLGLRWFVNEKERQVKLLAALQRVQLRPISVGWLLEVTVSYPLPSPPRLQTLSQPDRAYADFDGACLDLSEVLPSGMDILMGVRVGQFSSDPPIVRVVVDAKEPLRLYCLGRQPSKARREGETSFEPPFGERWLFLLQPAQRRQPWLGAITLEENSFQRAVVRLQGWFEAVPTLTQQGNRLMVEVPALFLLTERDEGRGTGSGEKGGSEKPLLLAPSEGVIQDIDIVPTERVTRILILLRAPLSGRLHPSGDEAWLLVIEPSQKPLRQRLIVVDAGHGGTDPGASSPFSPLVEKQLTLDIALRLRRLLQQAGYRVQMTREADVYISLAERVAIANKLQADAFVSVHLNSFPRPGESEGTEVYYWTPQSFPLAEAIYRNLLALVGRKGNGVRQRRFYVIHHTTMPSVLVEACYLNHPEEERLLRDENFREKIALAIFRGIVEFFGDRQLLQRAPSEIGR